MLPGIQALLELSRVDVQIAGLEHEKAGLPTARATLAAEGSAAEEAVARAEATVIEAEQAQRRHEAEAADREVLANRLESQQHQVKTNEAYTALLHEIDQARARISDAETAILEAMDVIESARSRLDRARTDAKAADDRIALQQRAIEEREKSLDQTLGNLHRERAALADGVDAPLLERYAKIASRRQPAVAIVSRETCMGCRVSLPPQLMLEMRKGERLITCGSCQRILVFEELN
jgi:predicted  nucleic acid-binding Zn-ribbon protein